MGGRKMTFVLDSKLAIEPEFGIILRDLVMFRRPNTVVEIGTGQGYSTTWILRGLNENKNGEVITFDEVNRSPYAWDAEGIPTDRVRTFEGTFSDMEKLLPAHIEMVFHDAGHWFEHVEKDLGLVIPRMHKGGLVLVHDVIYSFDMGERLKKWFESKEDWTYREIKNGCGLGIAEKVR
jgi:predicted O-methyltransferase YrrM